MKFRLITSGDFYTKQEKEELESVGFSFKVHDIERFINTEGTEIEISSLEELIALSERFGHLIVNPETIEIYDSYRE
jgi:hypothetical protein